MKSPEIKHYLKSFNELSVHELYDFLKLRSQVFVVEQNCVFLDQDDKDQKSHHLMIYKDEELVAYTRLVPAGLTFKELSIGRVITSASARGTGMGKKAMELSIQGCYELYDQPVIRIGAQVYAQPFYESLGFIAEGAVYDEDGIDHIEMIKPYEVKS